MTTQLTEQQIAAMPTLKVFHHYRLGRVCVYQPIPPSGRITWCSRSEITGHWMPCGSPHPPKHVIAVPIDPPTENEDPTS